MRTDRFKSYAERMESKMYPEIDYDYAVGGLYFGPAHYRGADYRVYESGMVRMCTAVHNTPDRREDFERIFGVQCKRLPEVTGKLFTPDGRRVRKSQIPHRHLWIDGDVAVACEQVDRSKVPDASLLGTKSGCTPSYVVYVSPDALPQSNNDIITLWPDKDKLALVDAAFKQMEAEGVIAFGALLEKFPHEVAPGSYHSGVAATAGHLMTQMLKGDYRRCIDDPRLREGYATAAAAMAITRWGAEYRKEWERNHCLRVERHYWLRWEE